MKRRDLSKWLQKKPSWFIRVSALILIPFAIFAILAIGAYRAMRDDGWPEIRDMFELFIEGIEDEDNGK